MDEIIERTQKIQEKVKEGWEFSRGLLPDHYGESDNYTVVLNADNFKRGTRKTIHTLKEFDEFLNK